MARIVDANKVEVLRTLDITEYGTTLKLRVSGDRSASVTIEFEDPRIAERQFVENAISEALDEDVEENSPVRSFASAILRALDARHTTQQGSGDERPYRLNLWFEPTIVDALANLLSADDLDFTTTETIREALKANTTGSRSF